MGLGWESVQINVWEGSGTRGSYFMAKSPSFLWAEKKAEKGMGQGSGRGRHGCR